MFDFNFLGYLFFVLALIVSSVYFFRHLVFWIDKKTDTLASKFINQPLSKREQLTPIIIYNIVILILLVVSTVCTFFFSNIIIVTIKILTNSNFIVTRNILAIGIGSLVTSVTISTVFIPIFILYFSPEKLQWLILRKNHEYRQKNAILASSWIRIIMSTGYMVAAILFLWSGISSYVRFTETSICKHHYLNLREECFDLTDLALLDLKTHNSEFDDQPILILDIYTSDEIWISIGDEIDVFNEGDLLEYWNYLLSRPSIKIVDSR